MIIHVNNLNRTHLSENERRPILLIYPEAIKPQMLRL